jgi:hypothetical protein
MHQHDLHSAAVIAPTRARPPRERRPSHPGTSPVTSILHAFPLARLRCPAARSSPASSRPRRRRIDRLPRAQSRSQRSATTESFASPSTLRSTAAAAMFRRPPTRARRPGRVANALRSDPDVAAPGRWAVVERSTRWQAIAIPPYRVTPAAVDRAEQKGGCWRPRRAGRAARRNVSAQRREEPVRFVSRSLERSGGGSTEVGSGAGAARAFARASRRRRELTRAPQPATSSCPGGLRPKRSTSGRNCRSERRRPSRRAPGALLRGLRRVA